MGPRPGYTTYLNPVGQQLIFVNGSIRVKRVRVARLGGRVVLRTLLLDLGFEISKCLIKICPTCLWAQGPYNYLA